MRSDFNETRKKAHPCRKRVGCRRDSQTMSIVTIVYSCAREKGQKLECWPMPNVMAALPNTGGVLCSTPPTTRVPCNNAAKTRNPLILAGVPKLTNRSQPLVGRSSSYCKNMWGRYCCLTSFLPIVDTSSSSSSLFNINS